MRLLCTMGCGRSKSASKTAADAPDNENNDIYHKLKSPGDKTRQKDTMVSDEIKANNNKAYSSATDTNHRTKLGPLQTNGELQTSPNRLDSSEAASGHRTMFRDRPSAGGPLQSSQHITTSQLEFFRMLDEKIEQGHELSEEEDT